MATARTDIRNHIKDLLIAANTKALSRIYASRAIPNLDKTLIDDGPVVLIYAMNERSSVLDESPRRYKRELTIMIEGAIAKTVSLTDDLDESLDDFAEEIEDVLFKAKTFYGNDTVEASVAVEARASDLELTATEFTYSDEGRVAFGAFQANYMVTYYTEEKTVSGLDDFEVGHVDWDLTEPVDEVGDMGPADPDIDASDEFEPDQT